jgi:hypothetical protein
MRRNTPVSQALSAGLFVAGLIAVAAVNAAPPQGLPQWQNLFQYQNPYQPWLQRDLQGSPPSPPPQTREQYQYQRQDRYRYSQPPPISPGGSWGGPRMGGGGGRR